MIVQCRVCKGLWPEERMATETLCIRCEALEYLEKNKGGDGGVEAKPEKQGYEGLPGKGERVKKPDGRSGQMSLSL